MPYEFRVPPDWSATYFDRLDAWYIGDSRDDGSLIFSIGAAGTWDLDAFLDNVRTSEEQADNGEVVRGAVHSVEQIPATLLERDAKMTCADLTMVEGAGTIMDDGTPAFEDVRTRRWYLIDWETELEGQSFHVTARIATDRVDELLPTVLAVQQSVQEVER